MRPGKTSSSKVCKLLQVIFYLLFVFLWLKDNFPPLRKWRVSPLFALAGFLAVTAVRIGPRLKYFRIKPLARQAKEWRALALILLLAAAIHIPYLIHNYGLMDSDEAIPSLQGKHIAEGRLPPIYYYGALFQGSLPQFFQALLFKVFGYSALLTKIAAFLAFMAFLMVQFQLLKDIFSSAWAFSICLFYVPPFMYLIQASFDVGSHFPVVFFLGTVVLAWTYKIYYRNQDECLAPLGFVMGLSFWTHQISIVFITASGVYLLLRYKLRIRNYLKLALYFCIGVFPVIMSEVYWKFPLIRMLSGGGAGVVSGSKIARFKKLGLTILSSGPAALDWIYLILILLGLGILLSFSIKKKKLLPSSLFAVYFLAFAAVYLLSQSSSQDILRYLYLLFTVLPVLFAAVFMLLKTKIRYAAAVLFFLLLFAWSNGKTSLAYYHTVKDRHAELRPVLTAMAETKEKYWQGHYWISYLINSISKENFIVASTTVERYPYYRLLYDSNAAHSNFIFLRDTPQAKDDASRLTSLLGRCGIEYKTKDIGLWLLVYDIPQFIYPKNLFFPPQEIPQIVLDKVTPAKTGLDLEFVHKGTAAGGGFRVDAEIPGYCSRFAPLPARPAEKFVVHMPLPPRERVKIRYAVNYQGLVIEPTRSEYEYLIPPAAAPLERDPVEYLTGLGPREKVSGKYRTVCAKEATLQINVPLRESAKIKLTFLAPMRFNNFWWHGVFVQEVEVYVNGQKAAQKTLPDGENILSIDCRFPPFQKGQNIIGLKFKYALALTLQDHWRTAALLEDVRIE